MHQENHWLAHRPVQATTSPNRNRDKLLCVVEGAHDIEFLTRISRIVHASDATLPDLAEVQKNDKLIFIPRGGGEILAWGTRLAALGLPQFHLADSEQEPETRLRRKEVGILNEIPRCQAVLCEKRALENYLHTDAIYLASGLRLNFGPYDDVASLAAHRCFERTAIGANWGSLSMRARKRLRDRAKKWLNSEAVDRMSSDLITEADARGEIRSWFAAIAHLLNRC